MRIRWLSWECFLADGLRTSPRYRRDVERVEGRLEQRFDRDVVPRQEQEVRDRMLDQRLEQMQRSLDAIQQELRRQSR